jgi:hypothetical protein
MANEFVARKGLIVPSGSNIWIVSGSVTASQFIGTASNAVSSSFAVSASYAPVAGFPFSGSAVITGSLNVTQAVTASYFSGDGSQLTNVPLTEGKTALRIDTYTFIADGDTSNYILSESVYQVDDIFVSVGGVTYTPVVDYTFSASTLTFVETPPSQSNIIIRGFIAIASGSVNTLSGSFIGNLIGTSSFAITASYASNVLKTKAGSVTNTTFSGTPLTASVTFVSSFSDTNYAISITGEDSRAWVVQNKTANGFVINSVSNTAVTGTTYWTCTAYGEN